MSGILPKLPVPALQETARRYARSVLPLLKTKSEHDLLNKDIANLTAPNGTGVKLHNMLLEKAKTSKTSWLIDWWTNLAYLDYRGSVVFDVSYFMNFHNLPVLNSSPNYLKYSDVQLDRAASLITGALNFRELIHSGKLSVDRQGKTEWCMEMYKGVFDACRIPFLERDVNTVYTDVKHFIVIHRNQFFSCPFADENGQLLPTSVLRKELQYICDYVEKLPKSSLQPPIGLLTSQNRDRWAEARTVLLEQGNESTLNTLQSGAFVVCLDETSPETEHDVDVELFHGVGPGGLSNLGAQGQEFWDGGQNRWYDKSFQLIIFKNGKAGLNGEHSWGDGTVTARMLDFILEKNHVVPQRTLKDDLPCPKHLTWKVNADCKKLETALLNARKHFNTSVMHNQIAALTFSPYGRNFIKKYRCSPDAWVQVAIQLAQYLSFGYFVPTYESAATRKFQYGRTETMRSLTVDSVQFVEAMTNSNLSVIEKQQALRKAIDTHVKMIKEAVAGQGVDRHLFGLNRLAIENQIAKPSLLQSPLFSYAQAWKLSTSNITSENFEVGWGAVEQDGVGVCYGTKKETLTFKVSTKADTTVKPQVFAQNIQKALLMMSEVMMQSGSKL